MKRYVLLFLGGYALSSNAALYGYGPAESWTINQISNHTSTIIREIENFGVSITTETEEQFERITSAIAVATKQEAVSAQKQSDMARVTHQQMANAMKAQLMSNGIAEATINYSGATGQGYDPCGTQAKNASLDMAFSQVDDRAVQLLNDLDTAHGSLTDVVKAQASRRDIHRNEFCTSAEAEAGICELSELPGGDTNASLLFIPASSDSKVKLARKQLIQHMLGTPDQSLSQQSGKTIDGQNFHLQKIEKDALLSIPAYSLAVIDAANTQSEEYGGRSPNEMLKLRVSNYFGGVEAKSWNARLASQTSRGLLVEQAKLSGMEAWIHHQQYKQNQRIEANLAALVVLANEKNDVNHQALKALQ